MIAFLVVCVCIIGYVVLISALATSVSNSSARPLRTSARYLHGPGIGGALTHSHHHHSTHHEIVVIDHSHAAHHTDHLQHGDDSPQTFGSCALEDNAFEIDSNDVCTSDDDGGGFDFGSDDGGGGDFGCSSD
jgi:hypothetical protein